jgi:AraC family transcriptional regulator, transcriptional activator FtrA
MKKPATARKPGLLAIVAYDQLRTFEYAIAAEVFALVRPSLGVPWYRTVVVGAEKGTLRGIGGVVVKPDAPLSILAEADTIVIPGWRDPAERPPQALLDALNAAAKRRARILSICSGAFVLGATGLLDGLRATTHWLFTEEFKHMFPAVEMEEDVLYVDEGNIITSAGSGAGIDACLHLVRRDYGARVANMVARRMVIAPHREGGQAQYVQTPISVRPGRTIGEVLDWARKRLDQPLAIGEMVSRTAMSSRTFLRQFHDSVGMTPNAWLQRERIARARELLESTAMQHTEIGSQCGYESPETFRIAFKRIVGVSPGAYRSRFSSSERA